MKPLTMTAAARCENACSPRCRCRCAGKAHGRNVDMVVSSRAFFESLPRNDPHYLPAKRDNPRRARHEQLALLPEPARPARTRAVQLLLPGV